MRRPTEQLQFIGEAGRLKAVLRQTMLTEPPRREGITVPEVLAKVQLIEDGSAEFGSFATDLIRRAAAGGMLAPDPAGG